MPASSKRGRAEPEVPLLSVAPRKAGSGVTGEARQATVHEAKTHLSRLLCEVEAGATVVITRRGKPVATLVPVPCRVPRVPGSMKGLIAIDERFFEPLPEDELRAWEGA